MKRMLMMLAVALMAARAMADTEVVDGITWTYTVNEGKASAGGEWDGLAIPESTQGAITIPSTLGGYPVTGIGDWAFLGCGELESVTIPEGVTSIGGYAFCTCSGLKSVTIPEGVANISEYAFYYCSGLKSVTIPSSVTNIGSSAFASCSELTSVVIPSGVTSIGDSSFSGCSGLTNVTISASVTNIGSSAFASCSGLTSVTIPSGVTSIGEGAFYDCSGLANVTISASVTNIGSSAFQNCSGLTSVDFEGAPPAGLSEAEIKADAAIRYNSAYEDEWLQVIDDCGFKNATSQEEPGEEKMDIYEWVGSTLAPKFKGAGETAADYRARFEAKFGTDYAVAFSKETGKVGQDGTKLQVWHDYVAGTDPLNENSVFTATIRFDENGVPKVEHEPTFADPDEAKLRKYTTWGKKQLTDGWIEVKAGEEADYNFFKVTVKMAE